MHSPKLILIPGLGGNKTHWTAQVSALSDLLEVHATEKHLDCLSISEMAANILSTYSGPVIVGGTSMGGFIALEMMRQAPDRICGLALFGTSASSENSQTAAVRADIVETITRYGFDSYTSSNFRGTVHHDRYDDEELAAVIQASIRDVGAKRYVAQIRAIMARPDASDILPRITCPTVVACGRQDKLMPPVHSRELVSAIKGAQLQMIDECGHMPSLEKPDIVVRLLRKLVDPVLAS